MRFTTALSTRDAATALSTPERLTPLPPRCGAPQLPPGTDNLRLGAAAVVQLQPLGDRLERYVRRVVHQKGLPLEGLEYGLLHQARDDGSRFANLERAQRVVVHDRRRLLERLLADFARRH